MRARCIAFALAAAAVMSLPADARAQEEEPPDGGAGGGGTTAEAPKPDTEAVGGAAATEPEPGQTKAAADADDKAAGAAADAAKKDGDEKDGDKQKGEDDKETFPSIDFSGYVRPGFGFRVRPDAVAKDRLEYGFFGEAGLTVEAKPFRMWHATVSVELDARGLENVVTNLEVFDFDGGIVVEEEVETFDGLSIEEASASFVPVEWFNAKAGVMRIPFTLQNQSQNVETMFPARSPANEVFLSGADIGLSLNGDFADGIFMTSIGVFNGVSLGLGRPGLESRGVVLAFRGDVSPWGKFTYDGEGDLKRGPFRLGAGFGLMFKPETLFDETTGTEPRTVYDLRLSGSLRLAFRGLYFVAEYFRRQLFDAFSSRPEVADGAYAQVAVFIPAGTSLGFEPIARLGFVALDQTFDPRLIGSIDAGINFYPVADAEDPGAVKLTLQYLGERRFSERENAHGGAVAVQVQF